MCLPTTRHQSQSPWKHHVETKQRCNFSPGFEQKQKLCEKSLPFGEEGRMHYCLFTCLFCFFPEAIYSLRAEASRYCVFVHL